MRFWKLTGLQKTEFSEQLGRSHAWLSNILNKDRNGNYKRFVSVPNAKLIEKEFGLSADWLLKGSIIGADPVMKEILPSCGKMYTKFREDRLRKIGEERPNVGGWRQQVGWEVTPPEKVKTSAEMEQLKAKEKQTAERNEQDRVGAAKVAIERLKQQEAEEKKKKQEAEQLKKFKEEQAQKKKQEQSKEQLVVKKPTQLSFTDLKPVIQHPMNGYWYVAHCIDPNNTRAYGVDIPNGETFYIGRIVEVCPGGQFAMIDELIWPKPKANHKDLDVKINWVRRKFRSMGFFTDYHTGDVRREVHFVPPKDFKDFESLVLVATWRGVTSLEGLFE
jgi:NAD-dependent dihydropyrimidine dehydrogenase PreA subunit